MFQFVVALCVLSERFRKEDWWEQQLEADLGDTGQEEWRNGKEHY